MKRDDVDLTAAAGVVRTPSWFSGRGGDALFGWLHEPTGAAGDAVAVICPPTGHEYTRAHRTLRHLADRLAGAGVAALRFDYHGCGDSAGSDLDPARVPAWEASIEGAIAEARRLTGRERVLLVGVRLGATLAARVSERIEVDTLVLWNPVVKGRAFVRELQAIAQMAARVSEDLDGGLEAAGFVTTAETLAAIRALDLDALAPRAARVLFVGRDDAASAVPAIASESILVPGWAGMMAEHQFTVVPDAALAAIVEEVTKNRGQLLFSASRKKEADPGFEVLARFGPGQGLFGIVSGPAKAAGRPAILLFNAGSVHHVGPNRIYVALARRLAELGHTTLRFDLRGIGDSPHAGAGPARENHPYPPHAQGDVRAAIEYLRREHGFERFIAMGLCSGAHTAFHAGLAGDIEGIEEVVLINPLTFHYVEGMSLETVTQFADAQQYRKSMRDPNRWLKLLRGDVNFRRLLEVALNHPRTLARSYYHSVCERVLPGRAPRLSQDLRRLFALDRRVTMLVAEGDPGRDILMAGARYTASRALRDGRLRLETIPGGDHTFSQSQPRRELTERLAAHLGGRVHAGTAE